MDATTATTMPQDVPKPKRTRTKYATEEERIAGNAAKRKLSKAAWREANKEKIREQHAAMIARHRQQDPEGFMQKQRLHCSNYRARLRGAREELEKLKASLSSLKDIMGDDRA